jgi:hypothetical protein
MCILAGMEHLLAKAVIAIALCIAIHFMFRGYKLHITHDHLNGWRFRIIRED